MLGENIWSGTRGLAGALTNMTVLAKRKGSIQQDYPVAFYGTTYEDAEAVYQANKLALDFAGRQALMAQIIACKLHQHPRLLRTIGERGGVEWLLTCRHNTGTQSQSKAWEGHGYASPFIRTLIEGYELAQSM